MGLRDCVVGFLRCSVCLFRVVLGIYKLEKSLDNLPPLSPLEALGGGFSDPVVAGNENQFCRVRRTAAAAA